ncbi:MAG: high frequency lysogenization protein HflD [Endozoicomonadaceae bacterium]|nr:high frequency lysogenization protein HflD [Endozoicomonadaceae bacterium]MCY4330638.1 high frequency lysogenization protein HflD [Endozoicomonadaceae bacterium]
MIYTDKDRTIALAAIFQCSGLVHELAAKGCAEESFVSACIDSLFVVSPGSVSEVYSPKDVLFGFKLLKAILKKSSDVKNKHILRYALMLIKLSKTMKKNKSVQDYIGEQIKQILRQREYLEKSGKEFDNIVITRLATLYRESISTLLPRIHVIGKSQHLHNEKNTHKIRALLLSGIRAAVLWQQTGGKSLHLVLPWKRKPILNILDGYV